jgi:hypothetical protein
MKAELFVQLLRRMVRHRSRPIHLVVNGLPSHKTKLVKDYVQSTKGRLTLHVLPTYALDLKPDVRQPFVHESRTKLVVAIVIGPQPSAWFRSAIRSSGSSIPTEMRISA